MALAAYLWARGERQGEILGSVTQLTREGSTIVYSIHHQLLTPTDRASGLATRARQHNPIVVRADVDRAYPLLIDAWRAYETLESVRLHLFRARAEQMAGTGLEHHYLTIELTDARLIGVELTLPHVNEHPALEAEAEYTFVYDSIRWEHRDGRTLAQDAWSDELQVGEDGELRRGRHRG
jgi:type VI secretion system secreted protein Hcp